MRKNYKKISIVTLLLISLGVTAWFIVWEYGARWIEDRIVLASNNLRQKGHTVSYSTMKISGNPLVLQMIIEKPHFKDSRGIIDWQGQAVKIIMKLWEPFTLYCSFPGKQKLIVPQYASLPLGVLHLEGGEGIVHLTSKDHLENVTFTANHLISFVEDQPQPLSLKDLSLNVSNLTNPINIKLEFSSELINSRNILNKNNPFVLNLVAELSGLKPLRPFPKSLAEWRDGGGVLEIRLFNIDWSPILAKIEGTLTLDEEMYPLGSFSSRIYGYKEAINNMVELGWVKEKKAIVALFMLDLFASSDEKGDKYLKAPITLQNKVLSIGPAPLLKLKPIGK